MPLYECNGKRPKIHPSAFVAPTATLVGDVTVEAGASIWYGVVLRADTNAIVIGEGTNVQDNSVLHASPQSPMVIGRECTIGHQVMFHGNSVGDRSLIGNGAVVLEWVTVGSGSVVAAQSLVTVHTEVPDGKVATGTPARITGDVQGMGALILEHNPRVYAELRDQHLQIEEISREDAEKSYAG